MVILYKSWVNLDYQSMKVRQHKEAHENDEKKKPYLSHSVKEDSLFCKVSGVWSLTDDGRDEIAMEWRKIRDRHTEVKEFHFLFEGLEKWDSSLIALLSKWSSELKGKQKKVYFEALPDGPRRLLSLSERKSSNKLDSPNMQRSLLRDLDFMNPLFNFVSFWGEWVCSIFRLLIGRSDMRTKDFLESARECGASALPIVTLISFLTGLTMAFVGSVQLEKFNAKIYVADLVCLAMVREMGALMVAIIMSGRTGAAFAAEIGNMKLNEEIDSLRTFGLSPMEFLVLPRTLALFVMTPLLTLYADVVGILGGLMVGTQVMDFSIIHYFEQTQSALRGMWEIFSGLSKSLFFGLIIGLVGCYKGLNTGSGSASLGRAVTSSVVLSITLVVFSDALFEVLFNFLDLR